MSAWGHLPNARHIDWVIMSVEKYPHQWDAAWYVVCNSTRYAARDAARDAARNATRNATRDATRDAAFDTKRWAIATIIGKAVHRIARGVAMDAIRALIAYDDCAHLLDMPSEQLKTWALLTEQPAAVLLLPAVIAREQIAQLEFLQT